MTTSLPRDLNRIVVAGGLYDDGSGTIAAFPINHTNGRLKITATVAGGVLPTLITFTGIVNGVNKVYTVSASPTYAVCDGIWYRATDANSNVQWTYNAGAGTVTFSNLVPQNDVFGF